MDKIYNADGTFYYAKKEYKGEVITSSKTLDADDSGKVFYVATDELVITLPSTAANLEYTFINSGADGNNIMTISPAAADGINGTITLAAAIVELSGTVNKDIINTKASATTGNTVKLKGTGIAGSAAWMVEYSTGIFASE